MPCLASLALLCSTLSASVAALGGSSGDAPNSARKLLAPPPPDADAASTGKRVHFDWSRAALQGPRKDSLRYQAEINALLASPLSDWEVVKEV